MGFYWGLYISPISPHFHPEKSGVMITGLYFTLLINWLVFGGLLGKLGVFNGLHPIFGVFLFCFQVKLEVGFFNGVVSSREEVIKDLGISGGGR